MVEIRVIKENEIDSAKAIMKSSFPSSYYSIFYLYPETTLVALIDNKVVGGINLDVYDATIRVGYVGWLYVDAAARGLGIGEKLAKKAIEFLEHDVRVDETVLCIEGDNPSSFKNFSPRGFDIMSLGEQIKCFKWNIGKVYKHASRFFDMGYFLWHKKNGVECKRQAIKKSPLKSILSLLFTVLFNTLLFTLSVAKFKAITPYTLLIPLFLLTLRALTEAIVLLCFKTKSVYLSWDTSWLSSIISVLLPFYFPSPGGVYVKGDEWKLKDKAKALGVSALITVAAEAIALFAFRGSIEYLFFALPLFLLDTLFSFYPFCGFLASRIKRITGKKQSLIYLFVVIVIIGIFIA